MQPQAGLLSGVGKWLGSHSSAEQQSTPANAVATLQGSWLSHLDCTFLLHPLCSQDSSATQAMQHQPMQLAPQRGFRAEARNPLPDAAARRIWSVHDAQRCAFQSVCPVERLATDSTFREDVQLLARGDLRGAAAAKQRLEEEQRRARKQLSR